ncbi:MAG: hypothetical protein GX767_05255, partial [Firmicutes bacterium]|nr:hypothetical protein [Bacillota bacterium]
MENLVFGIEVSIVGLIVVMVALLLLALILVGFGKVLAPEKEKKRTGATAKSILKEPAPEQSNMQLDKSGEVVAVISSALSLVLDKPFRIHQIVPDADGGQSRWLLAYRARSVQL